MTAAAEGAGSPCRWRSPVGLRERSGAGPRAQAVGRAGDAGRSDATVDLGVEEHGEACHDPDADGASDQCRHSAHGVGELGFSRQSNRKADEGSKHPDRNAQFEYINSKVIAAQAQQQPVISVDTKKKELVGNFKNGGTDYRPKGDPQRVNVHDFENKKLGKVVPYGVYDVTANTGFISARAANKRRF